MRTPRSRWWLSATVVLVAINIVVYIIQTRILPDSFTKQYLELSLFGLHHGYVWQLITYQFLHGSIPHILLNCWALFVFGRDVEWTVGKPRFLALYFSSGVIGGLFQMAAALLWPQYFGGLEHAAYEAVIGASASVFGIVAAFAMLFPNQRLIMLLFFVIPLNIRARSLLWLVLIITTIGISLPNSSLVRLIGGNVAHFAHFGGILTGIAVSRFYFLRFLPPRAADE
ncbi:MAG TPA: rhomboid family intramembrane serine protease [Candidatus Angelobacter sp.]|nr:rhomboid family intramembrane serine protease [Candidatus Angelobacter sp.]